MRWILVVLLGARLWGLDNAVTVYEAAGKAQNGRPMTLLRAFAQGEFPAGSWPKPRMNGVVAAAWQADISTTWPDGSAQLVYVSYGVTLAANGSVVVDFVRDSGSCHRGGVSVCQAAGLSQAEMLAFNGGTWNVSLNGTANAITNTASARTMLGAGAWSYQLRGPVATRVLIEDVTRPLPAFDFGWQWDGTAWQTPAVETYKSVHPIFVATFAPGWAGVEVEVIAENPWTTRGQKQVFDLSVTTSGGTAYAKSAFELAWASMFTRLVWDGTKPDEVQVDHNLKYLIASRMLMPYDYTQSAPTWVVNNVTSFYDTVLGTDDPQSCTHGAYCANWLKYIPTTGARGEIAPVPQWYMNYLFVMGDTANYTLAARKVVWDKQVLGNADAALTMPIVLRELDNSSYRDAPADGQRYYFNYQSDQATPAWGRVYSVQARPGGRIGYTVQAIDNIAAVCTSGACNSGGAANNKGWTMDDAHIGSAFFVPYLLTGRYSYLQGLWGAASWHIGILETTAGIYGNRNLDHGLLALYTNWRATAWAMRDIHYALLAAPDGSPEKVYFRDILRRNEAFYEGVLNIVGGNAGATGAPNSCAVSTYSSRTDTFSGTSVSHDACGALLTSKTNGLVRGFPVCRPIVAVSSVSVNGVARSVGIAGVDSGKDWYYTPGHGTLMQASGAAALTASDTLSMTYSYGQAPASDWCHGRGIYMRSMPNPIMFPAEAVSSVNVFYMGLSTNGLVGSGGFMLMYLLMTMRQVEATGGVLSANGAPLFDKVNGALATFVLDPSLRSGGNPYWMDIYNWPAMLKTGSQPQSWAEWYGGFASSMSVVNALGPSDLTVTVAGRINNDQVTVSNPLIRFPSLMKLDNEWMLFCEGADGAPNSTLTVCEGGRGRLGTVASPHAAAATLSLDRQLWGYSAVDHNYSNLYADTVALFEDLSTAYGTGRRAWERVWGTQYGAADRNVGLHWMMVPRERIRGVVRSWNGAERVLTWVAPSAAACRVYLGASDSLTSSDAGDAPAHAAGRQQWLSLAGYASGTYRYRISCGTARAVGAVTVP